MTHTQPIPSTMRALVAPFAGAPLELRELPVPGPRHGEVLVRMAAAPVNPADLLMLRGEYGRSWAFPFVPGLEGAGRVVASGGGLLGRLVLGKAVAVAADQSGLWAEWVTVPANRCVALPRDAALGAGAMSFVNPLTAIALVHEARRARHASAISAAAGGALGRMIRARAATEGLEIINVVRREEQAAALRAEGAAHVVATEAADFDSRLAELCRQLQRGWGGWASREPQERESRPTRRS